LGYTLIDTSDPNFALFYGGSDDDLAFAPKKVDLNGKPVKYASLLEESHVLKPEVTRDDKFARLAWARVLKGNAEAATNDACAPPNIDGFIGTRDVGGNGQPYIKPENLRYVEAAQLTYTLTRPDVYDAIMAIPGYSWKFEEELGVDKSKGMDSYDYMVTYEAITAAPKLCGALRRESATNPGYRRRAFLLKEYGGSVSGPLSRHASFTLDVERTAIDNGAIINGSTFDAQTLVIIDPYTQVFRVPQRRIVVTPRADYQLNSKNTLTIRYIAGWADIADADIGSFNLVSPGYDIRTRSGLLQTTEAMVIGASAVNETGFQYFHVANGLTPNSTGPAIQVLVSFTGGRPPSATLRTPKTLANFTITLLSFAGVTRGVL
jgi:hypothetical protein